MQCSQILTTSPTRAQCRIIGPVRKRAAGMLTRVEINLVACALITGSPDLDEVLRRKGRSVSQEKRLKFLDPKYWVEKATTKHSSFAYNHEMEDLTVKLARHIPRKTELKKSTYITNFRDSLAWAEKDFSGMNPFGGVKLNKEKTVKEKLNYTEVTNRIIQEIAQTRDRETKAVNWITSREEIYQGKFIDKHPDIIFKLYEEHGLGFSLYLPITLLNATHKKISGGHRRLGIFFILNLESGFNSKHLFILDVIPTILDLLDTKSNIEFNGKRFLVR